MKTVSGHGNYIRGIGLIGQIGEYVAAYGKRACLFGGKTALSLVSDPIIKSLQQHGIEVLPPIWYGGECSESNIYTLKDRVVEFHPDVLLVAGGGKAIDTVKALGFLLNLPVIAIPTIASTCAAATCISILYDDQGEYLEISRKSKSPDLIVVDTQVILEAPVRYLTSGIGDTIAKWFESKAANQKAAPNAFNCGAVALARFVYELLLKEGKSAAESIDKRVISSELEDVIDAIIVVSGSISNYGGDDCRTAAAHAVYSGLTIFPEVHEVYHGEIVAFGILTQLALEGRPDEEILEVISYYKQVNLPSTLGEMGIDTSLITEEQWKTLGSVTVEIEDMANMPFAVTPQMVTDGIHRADQLGRSEKERSL
ncbi:iron-containing alcohol dehydrogenase [Desulfosporosinus fructosivorans]|uniref:Iron-containing alcohol dehydrogenase n=1 Tax=Desulfosporosinus fructosivorans TaxID=2018669 RepID=A0A4Z0RAR3_9FIRM|nr:iron-containing alcohol dehydrogenase family protein [Desulfosporosinus fructosivorans]TGE39247.1 iron-containing alcohol dehydrogenase [Desulfosporosinus fructosivorans]